VSDLSSQTFSWSGSGSQFLIQFIDSNNYLDFYDLTSSTKTINTSKTLIKINKLPATPSFILHAHSGSDTQKACIAFLESITHKM
jgi:hypothetical protein